MTCRIVGCGRKSFCRSLCNTHYVKLLKSGEIEKIFQRWSAEEDEILRSHYVKRGTKGCSRFLIKRTVASIFERARKLGLSRDMTREGNPNWKGDSVGLKSARARALRWFAGGVCGKCGTRKAERHHKDGNTRNNDKSNIDLLCRRCHMQEDGRLKNFNEMRRGKHAK